MVSNGSPDDGAPPTNKYGNQCREIWKHGKISIEIKRRQWHEKLAGFSCILRILQYFQPEIICGEKCENRDNR